MNDSPIGHGGVISSNGPAINRSIFESSQNNREERVSIQNEAVSGEHFVRGEFETGPKLAERILRHIKEEGIDSGFEKLAQGDFFSNDERVQNSGGVEDHRDVADVQNKEEFGEETPSLVKDDSEVKIQEEQNQKDQSLNEKVRDIKKSQSELKTKLSEDQSEELRLAQERLEKIEEELAIMRKMMLLMFLYLSEKDSKKKEEIWKMLSELTTAVIRGIMTGNPEIEETAEKIGNVLEGAREQKQKRMAPKALKRFTKAAQPKKKAA